MGNSAGGKIELVYDHSPLTLGDWIAAALNASLSVRVSGVSGVQVLVK